MSRDRPVLQLLALLLVLLLVLLLQVVPLVLLLQVVPLVLLLVVLLLVQLVLVLTARPSAVHADVPQSSAGRRNIFLIC